MIIRGRILLPLKGPAIENGWIQVLGGRIAGMGAGQCSHPQSSDSIDLGEVVLLPGLVNAHCHLDFTCMAGLLPCLSEHFADWIKGINALKGSHADADYKTSWLDGARMLLRSGCTTVADHESIPSILSQVRAQTPLRVHSFIELIGIRKPAGEILSRALAALPEISTGSVQVSPHAPYSTTPELMQLTAQMARQKGWPLSIHLAESRDEYDMFKHRKGSLFDWLNSQRNMEDCDGCTPVRQAFRNNILSRRTLAVHANYLDDEDIGLLAQSGASVAHCPRSHLYFEHVRFPYERLVEAGINICLGTDSLATVNLKTKKKPELSLFKEMRSFLRYHPQCMPEEALRMAAVNGAKALGLAGQVGELSSGAQADIIAMPFNGSTSTAAESIIFSKKGPVACMIGGVWQYRKTDASSP